MNEYLGSSRFFSNRAIDSPFQNINLAEASFRDTTLPVLLASLFSSDSSSSFMNGHSWARRPAASSVLHFMYCQSSRAGFDLAAALRHYDPLGRCFGTAPSINRQDIA